MCGETNTAALASQRRIIWYVRLNPLPLSTASSACTLMHQALKRYLAVVPQGLKHLLPYGHIILRCLFKHMPTLTFCPMLTCRVSQLWLFQLCWQTRHWQCFRWRPCPVSTVRPMHSWVPSCRQRVFTFTPNQDFLPLCCKHGLTPWCPNVAALHLPVVEELTSTAALYLGLRARLGTPPEHIPSSL